jgi:hypothetical protein
MYLKGAGFMALAKAIETQLHATGETLLRKYEAAPGASQKIEAPSGYLKIR